MGCDQERLVCGESSTDWILQLDRLLSCISHDLKNPLSIIRGNAQLAMMANHDPKTGICLNRIINAVDDINSDLNDIRCLHKTPNSSMVRTSLNTVIQDVIDKMQSQFSSSGINVECHLDEEASALMNAANITIALRHLVQNAVQAMPEGGTLAISLRVDPSYAWLTISDTGNGIGQEVESRLFKEVISTRHGAKGLGLILADQVIRVSHGGRLAFNTNSHGTTFTVQLPLDQSEPLTQ